MRDTRKRYPALLLLLTTLSCGGEGAASDAGSASDASFETDASSARDATPEGDASSSADGFADDLGYSPDFFATGSGEHDLGQGWIGAAQPSQARLTEVVELGARIISLRSSSEESFDEEALVTSLGGTFFRYATSTSELRDQAFREGLYDLYDEQRALGGNVYLHCASSNRVGATWALYHAERLGYPGEEAIQIGRDAGLSGLESVVREILGLS